MELQLLVSGQHMAPKSWVWVPSELRVSSTRCMQTDLSCSSLSACAAQLLKVQDTIPVCPTQIRSVAAALQTALQQPRQDAGPQPQPALPCSACAAAWVPRFSSTHARLPLFCCSQHVALEAVRQGRQWVTDQVGADAAEAQHTACWAPGLPLCLHAAPLLHPFFAADLPSNNPLCLVGWIAGQGAGQQPRGSGGCPVAAGAGERGGRRGCHLPLCQAAGR